jgi:hypothetical protein
VLFCVGTLLAIWTSQIWLPTIQGQLLARSGIHGAAAAPFIGEGMTLWGIDVRLHRGRDRPAAHDHLL